MSAPSIRPAVEPPETAPAVPDWTAEALNAAERIAGRWAADSRQSQLSSTDKFSASETMTYRSMTFCSSRMLPGQGYDWSRSRVFLFTLRIFFPALLAYRSVKYSTSKGMSSLRSRKGGISRGNTLRR